MAFGRNLKTYLSKNNITVVWLSKETGIPAQTIYSIIKRDANPDVSKAIKISVALNIDIKDLLAPISNSDSVDEIIEQLRITTYYLVQSLSSLGLSENQVISLLIETIPRSISDEDTKTMITNKTGLDTNKKPFQLSDKEWENFFRLSSLLLDLDNKTKVGVTESIFLLPKEEQKEFIRIARIIANSTVYFGDDEIIKPE
jgi:transcriptional regulator with XRE-family HTH domain